MLLRVSKVVKTAANQSTSSRGSTVSPREAGAVLLEVVLALTLFVGAAIVIGSALQASIAAVDRLRHETHAANLATTVLSEVQMGVRSLSSGGPEPFLPPFEKWTWEIVLGPAEEKFSAVTALQRVEVVIRHKESTTAYRRAQFLPPREDEATVVYQPPPRRRENLSLAARP